MQKVFLFCLFLLESTHGIAQVPPMSAPTFNQLPLYYLFNNRPQQPNVDPGTLYIVLKNDSTISTRASINMKDSVHSIKVRENSVVRIITPQETKLVYRYTTEGMELAGIPTSIGWLFLTGEGKINTYSYKPEAGSRHTIAIQKGNEGRIVPLTKENLERMVGISVEANILIEKGKLTQAIDSYNNHE